MKLNAKRSKPTANTLSNTHNSLCRSRAPSISQWIFPIMSAKRCQRFKCSSARASTRHHSKVRSRRRSRRCSRCRRRPRNSRSSDDATIIASRGASAAASPISQIAKRRRSTHQKSHRRFDAAAAEKSSIESDHTRRLRSTIRRSAFVEGGGEARRFFVRSAFRRCVDHMQIGANQTPHIVDLSIGGHSGGRSADSSYTIDIRS